MHLLLGTCFDTSFILHVAVVINNSFIRNEIENAKLERKCLQNSKV